MSELTLFDTPADNLTTSEGQELAELEATIERGLQTFVDVGRALLRIRDARLYREQWGTFEEYCRERWAMQRHYANRLIAAAEVTVNLVPIGTIPATESQARPLTRLEPEQQRQAWQTAVETAPNGKLTAAHVQRTVDDLERRQQEAAENADGYDWTDDTSQPAPRPHVAHNSGNNEWYTPPEYIEAARLVMGSIDLDPATSIAANEVVQADTFYTIDDDGLAHHWTGNVWMNPPYAADLVGKFAEKLFAHIAAEDVHQAIVLVNNATETGWFNKLVECSTAIVFPRGRVRFWKQDGETGAPLQGQAILYAGNEPDAFIEEFSRFGWGCYLV